MVEHNDMPWVKTDIHGPVAVVGFRTECEAADWASWAGGPAIAIDTNTHIGISGSNANDTPNGNSGGTAIGLTMGTTPGVGLLQSGFVPTITTTLPATTTTNSADLGDPNSTSPMNMHIINLDMNMDMEMDMGNIHMDLLDLSLFSAFSLSDNNNGNPANTNHNNNHVSNNSTLAIHRSLREYSDSVFFSPPSPSASLFSASPPVTAASLTSHTRCTNNKNDDSTTYDIPHNYSLSPSPQPSIPVPSSPKKSISKKTVVRSRNNRISLHTDSSLTLQLTAKFDAANLVAENDSAINAKSVATVPLPTRKFTCHICANKFLRKQDMDRHVATHNPVRLFSCPVSACSARFARRDAMVRHTKSARCIGNKNAQAVKRI